MLLLLCQKAGYSFVTEKGVEVASSKELVPLVEQLQRLLAELLIGQHFAQAPLERLLPLAPHI